MGNLLGLVQNVGLNLMVSTKMQDQQATSNGV